MTRMTRLRRGYGAAGPPSRKATAGQVTRERARATRATTAVEAAVTAAIRRNSQATPLPRIDLAGDTPSDLAGDTPATTVTPDQ